MLIDTFLYNDEKELLEIRLAELGGVVDEFIAIQGSETFDGAPREIAKLPECPKLRTVVAPRYPDAPNRWAREMAQRNVLLVALADYPADALVMHGDADEIGAELAVDAMKYLVSDGAWARIEMDLFYYYLNLKVAKPWRSLGTTTLKDLRALGPNHYRFAKHPSQVLKGGWHFSWLGGEEAIRRKFAITPHEEVDIPKYTQRISQCLLAQVNIFNGEPLQSVPLSELPREVQQHRERYEHLLI